MDNTQFDPQALARLVDQAAATNERVAAETKALGKMKDTLKEWALALRTSLEAVRLSGAYYEATVPVNVNLTAEQVQKLYDILGPEFFSETEVVMVDAGELHKILTPAEADTFLNVTYTLKPEVDVKTLQLWAHNRFDGQADGLFRTESFLTPKDDNLAQVYGAKGAAAEAAQAILRDAEYSAARIQFKAL